ncbi:bifunctional glutamate N-acetyltransferase/amino-acid acetyltransferase ArgJ [Prosthecobacter sp.]|uniref:bifunctional glutamate N-acetyltransferase/amino-acid acetyltransferase ArgJ n=1 Tax=Prosthecobacter sp. TaxID=1965333 RepID=UPI001DAD0C33|nr:bifunctional glutamate N-acetyltransferase/amino-acid acetyltransferase ArgJ [Prosthecobacter sp.]MCB1278498.1 bifunctional glutamate N-acetyltransferase/amino-acid acetyltransferase ArgJ [Prosthecobacter sp.]
MPHSHKSQDDPCNGRVPFKVIEGGVTAAKGFRASAVNCGIKNPEATRLDLALIVSDTPTVTDAVFTTNKVRAACVRVCQQHLKESDTRAIIANSGNANACTGVQGIQDAKAMTKAVAEELGVKMRQVMVCSTGIIGMPMPIERILPKVPAAVEKLSDQGSEDAMRAIMTSDTRPKTFAVDVPCGKGSFRIGGIAKGAGMICPNMATMLCFITTDAKIGKDELHRSMRYAVEKSFNCITIDGDTSTNDTVIVMSNGQSDVPTIRKNSPEAELFRCALHKVMLELAKMIVCDGERVTKFVEIRVRNARTLTDARKVAETVAKSLLVKCSFHGCDPNWGRIIHAVGYSGARIREELIDIYFGGLQACKGGLATKTPISEMEKVVKEPKFTVTIDLNLGTSGYTVYTSDLSEEYVDFNSAEYSAAIHAKRQKGFA